MKHVSYHVNPRSGGRGVVGEGLKKTKKKEETRRKDKSRQKKERMERKEQRERGEKARTCRYESGGRKQRNQRDKAGVRAIGSHVADILVSLSSVPTEATYMNPDASSDFMVSLESNEHNTVLSWHQT